MENWIKKTASFLSVKESEIIIRDWIEEEKFLKESWEGFSSNAFYFKNDSFEEYQPYSKTDADFYVSVKKHWSDSEEPVEVVVIYKKVHFYSAIKNTINNALATEGKNWGDLETQLFGKKTNNLSRSYNQHKKIIELERIFSILKIKINWGHQ